MNQRRLKTQMKEASLSKKDFIASLKDEYKSYLERIDYHVNFETFLLNKLYNKTINKKTHY